MKKFDPIDSETSLEDLIKILNKRFELIQNAMEDISQTVLFRLDERDKELREYSKAVNYRFDTVMNKFGDIENEIKDLKSDINSKLDSIISSIQKGK